MGGGEAISGQGQFESECEEGEHRHGFQGRLVNPHGAQLRGRGSLAIR